MNDFSAFVYEAGWNATKFMPETLAYKTFDLIADQLWFARGARVSQLEHNLQLLDPDLEGTELRIASRRSMRSYLRYWCDVFRISKWSPERIVGRTRVLNAEYLEEALNTGGVIISLPHSGNWDHAGAWAALSGYQVSTVAERLEPESLFESFVQYREKLGMKVYPLDSRVLISLKRDVENGRLIALVADREYGSGGVSINFLQKAVRFPIGPAALSIQTGRPVIPTHVSYTKNGILIHFSEPIWPDPENSRDEELVRITQQCAEFFEMQIREYPHDWHMLQPIALDKDGDT